MRDLERRLQEDKSRRTSVLMMSASSRIAVRDEGIMAEVDGFLCRPFQRNDLERCFVNAGLRDTPARRPTADRYGDFGVRYDEVSGELIVRAQESF